MYSINIGKKCFINNIDDIQSINIVESQSDNSKIYIYLNNNNTIITIYFKTVNECRTAYDEAVSKLQTVRSDPGIIYVNK